MKRKDTTSDELKPMSDEIKLMYRVTIHNGSDNHTCHGQPQDSYEKGMAHLKQVQEGQFQAFASEWKCHGRQCQGCVVKLTQSWIDFFQEYKESYVIEICKDRRRKMMNMFKAERKSESRITIVHLGWIAMVPIAIIGEYAKVHSVSGRIDEEDQLRNRTDFLPYSLQGHCNNAHIRKTNENPTLQFMMHQGTLHRFVNVWTNELLQLLFSSDATAEDTIRKAWVLVQQSWRHFKCAPERVELEELQGNLQESYVQIYSDLYKL